MPMTAQNAAHACDCGKVKVTLLNKRNAVEALTAPLNGKAIAIDDFFSSYQRTKVRRYVGSNGGTHGHAPSYQSSAVQLSFAKNKQLSSPKGTGGFAVRFLFLLFSKNFSKSVDKRRT